MEKEQENVHSNRLQHSYQIPTIIQQDTETSNLTTPFIEVRLMLNEDNSQSAGDTLQVPGTVESTATTASQQGEATTAGAAGCMQTLSVDMHTTASEVVSLLINSNNKDSCQQDIKQLCLVECIDSKLGSWKRIIPDREKVLLVKQKWKKNRQGQFLLTKRKLIEVAGPGSQSCSALPPHLNPNTSRMFQRRYSLPATELKDDQPQREELRTSRSVRQSLNEISDMSKLMSQVVHESDLNIRQLRRGSWSGGGERGSLLSPDIVKIEPLVCSPSYSATRAYPEFIFSPVAESQEEEENTAVPLKRNILSTVSEMDAGGTTSESDCEESSRIEVSKMEDRSYVLVHTAVLKNHHPIQPKKVFVKQKKLQLSPVSTHRISVPMSSSQETQQITTTLPTKAAVTSAITTESSSEMNLVDSLSSIFDLKLSTQGVQSNNTDVDHDSLISPKRRASLVSEACNNIQRKRSITHPTDQPKITDRLPANSIVTDSTPRKSTSYSVLVSPSHQQNLVEAASEFIHDNRRRKSHGEATYHQPSLILDFKPIQDDKDNTFTQSTAMSTCSDETSTEYESQEGPQEIGTIGIVSTTVANGEESPGLLSQPNFRRHKSERSKSRLFSFLNRKGANSKSFSVTPPTTSDESEQQNKSSLVSSDSYSFKRSRSAHYKRHRDLK